MPTEKELVGTWLTPSDFSEQAGNWYMQTKQKAFKDLWVDVTDQDNYLSQPVSVKTDIDKSLSFWKAILEKAQAYKKAIEETGWAVNPLWEDYKKLSQAHKDLVASVKESQGYNLWVLNWKDLEVLESIIPSAVWPIDYFNSENQAKSMWNFINLMQGKLNANLNTYWLNSDFSKALNQGSQSNQIDQDSMKKLDTLWNSLQLNYK